MIVFIRKWHKMTVQHLRVALAGRVGHVCMPLPRARHIRPSALEACNGAGAFARTRRNLPTLVSKLDRLTRLPALWTLFGVGIIRGVRSEFRSSLRLDTVSRKPPPASETCSPTNVTCHHRSCPMKIVPVLAYCSSRRKTDTHTHAI